MGDSPPAEREPDAGAVPAPGEQARLFDRAATLPWVRELTELMREHDLTELVLKQDGMKLKLRRGDERALAPVHIATGGSAAAAPAPPAPGSGSAGADGGKPRTALGEGVMEVRSPMVGTFYRSPAPDAAPFVEVGDKVGEDTTLGIIEAMKVMNEIKAETEGIVTEVLLQNGEAVEYGQALVRIRRTR